MKSFGMLKLPMIFVGLGAALAFSPSCKAQEVSPDHFTATGVQDVYEAPGKAAAPKAKQKPPTSEAGIHQTTPPANLQPVAKRTPVSLVQQGVPTVADRRKPVPSTPKKQ
jgi:hypothetical protein